MSKAVPLHVLFLCTDNSVRSIMAEVMLRHWGGTRFVAHSAAANPAEAVSSLALDVLNFYQLPTYGLRTKRWDEFSGSNAPKLDYVFTLSDDLTQVEFPAWPGTPVTAHWPVYDPAQEVRSPRERVYAFQRALKELELRVRQFVTLPLDDLRPEALRQQLVRIGQIKLLP